MSRRFLIVAGALAVLVSCGGDRGDGVDRQTVPSVVASAAVKRPAALSVPATVRSERSAELATRVSSTIRRVTVDVGDRIGMGQLLIQLDDADAGAGVARAEADLELARRYHARIEALERDGAATGQELDEAIARLRVAEAGARAARGDLDYAELRAPFAGVVTARYADPGDLAVPGRPLLELAGDGDLVVEADLPARTSVPPGQTVYLEATAHPGSAWSAEITRVVPALDPTSQRYRVEGRLTDPDGDPPVPNAAVTMTLTSGSDSVVVVPADAVFRRGQLTGVLVVRDSILRLRWIRSGRGHGSSVEALSGLSAGDLVVRRPDESMLDGHPVESVDVVAWRPGEEAP